MTKRLALLAAALTAAATFAAPASADPPCFSQQLSDCLKPVQAACDRLVGNCRLT
jgi:precorrin-3B methylase